MATTKAFETVYLAPERVHFSRNGDTLAMALDDGARYPRVVLRCCFPVSEEEVYLSVRDATEEEQTEIGIIRNWTGLAEADRQAVAAELGLHYFVPRILRVRRIKDELGFLYWDVETDKGDKEFVMRNSVIHYTREVSPGHLLLIDVNEARYEIPDINALDQHSVRLLKRFLFI